MDQTTTLLIEKVRTVPQVTVSRLTELPEKYPCKLCGAVKVIGEMCLVHTKGKFVLRPRCKECHNKREAGHRREYKTRYQREWRRRNKQLHRSYWDNDQCRETNKLRMRAYVAGNKEALAIQRRLRIRGISVTLVEASELLQQYGRCYPTKHGLTPEGQRECERIRSTQRRRGMRHPLTSFQIRLMVYEDGLFIKPSRQPTPYQKAAKNMRQRRAVQCKQKTRKPLPLSQSCATLRATSVAATA